MTKKKQSLLVTSIILLLVLIDQWIKIYVKTHFILHESCEVTNWFQLVFVENNGMAFGLEFGAKLFLSVFRIVACGALIWYIVRLIKRGVKCGYLITIGVILAGALGNIFDGMFYGLIFNSPTDVPAEFVSFGDGYAGFLEGKVVDMFYFPLFEWDWPSWFPFVGGDHFIFFSPIFNFADSCITCGMFAFLIFYHSVLTYSKDQKNAKREADNETADTVAEMKSDGVVADKTESTAEENKSADAGETKVVETGTE